MEETGKDSLTHAVIGVAIEVHRIMGPGLLESVYQRCMHREFRLRGIDCDQQVRLPLVYKGEAIDDGFVMDFFFPGQLVVELKAVEKLLPIHEAQLLTYFRLSGTWLGLLMNFNVVALRRGIKRIVNG